MLLQVGYNLVEDPLPHICGLQGTVITRSKVAILLYTSIAEDVSKEACTQRGIRTIIGPCVYSTQKFRVTQLFFLIRKYD